MSLKVSRAAKCMLAPHSFIFFTANSVNVSGACKVSRTVSQHGHVRGAEEKSAGLPLTLNTPPCRKKEKYGIEIHSKRMVLREDRI